MSDSNPNKRDRYEKIGEFTSIFPLNGIWRVNYQIDGKQRRRTLKTRSKKEARRKALRIEKAIQAGESVSPVRAPLIKDVVEQYMAHLKAKRRSAKTITKYQYCFELLLNLADQLRITRISQINLSVVDQFRATRVTGKKSQRAASPKTVHTDTICIRQLVNFALNRDLIAVDPLRKFSIERPKRTPQPYWTFDERERILGEAKPPNEAPLIFLSDTGTRVGEAKWLTWPDLDFERRLIHIRPKDGWTPKSGDERVVPMSDRLYSVLVALPRHGRWVFTAPANSRDSAPGRQISERRLLEYLKRILKRLGLRGHLHTFRHTFISLAAYEGVPERVLRDWVGHVDQRILDWYFHLADAQSQESMKRLSKAASRRKSAVKRENGSAQSQHKKKGASDGKSAK